MKSPFQPGDEVWVQRNLFGIAISYIEVESGYGYFLDFPFFFYFALAFLTFISAFFHDGTAEFALNFLKIIGVLDIAAMILYFFNVY